MLTAERLREALHYDHETGVFTWRSRTSNRVKIGDIAGAIDLNGYRLIGVDGRLYKAHRLAWLYVYGRWPVKQIDHINGVRDDNRFANLREATSGENHQNITRRSDNTSGFIGVTWHRQNMKWMAQIRVDGRYHYLGCFNTSEEANAAYLKAKADLHTFQPVPREAA